MTTYPLMICTDCMFIIAYDADAPQWSEYDAWRHRADMAEHLEGLHVTLGDSEDGEEFSKSQCDACGSRYAGARHAATAWPIEEEA